MRILLHIGVIFFLSLSFLSAMAATAQSTLTCTDSQTGGNKRFVSTNLNLRASPSRYADVLVTLPEGEVVYAYRRYNEWSQVNVASLNITGFVATRYLSDTCIEGGGLSRSKLSNTQIATILMASSQNSYSGSCPCPFNVDRGGRRCGRRSAYSRPGGQSPLCYPRDVQQSAIQHFRTSRQR